MKVLLTGAAQEIERGRERGRERGGGGGEGEGEKNGTFTAISNERAWKLRALRYALLLSSSCMLSELMEMFSPLIGYIIVLQKVSICSNNMHDKLGKINIA